MKLISISAVCYCRICWPKELARQATSSGIHFAIYLFTYAYGPFTHTFTHTYIHMCPFVCLPRFYVIFSLAFSLIC